MKDLKKVLKCLMNMMEDNQELCSRCKKSLCNSYFLIKANLARHATIFFKYHAFKKERPH